MITILAEKPSVAREIARIVGAMKREEGYFTGNGYHVTWALGHLVQLALPDGYGIKGFRRDSLPVIPKNFELIRSPLYSLPSTISPERNSSMHSSRVRTPYLRW